jgi:hypothetical protein
VAGFKAPVPHIGLSGPSPATADGGFLGPLPVSGAGTAAGGGGGAPSGDCINGIYPDYTYFDTEPQLSLYPNWICPPGLVVEPVPDVPLDVGTPLDYGGNSGVAWQGDRDKSVELRRLRRQKQQAVILAAIKAFTETVGK